ncbi:ABC transporter permease [Chthonobacter rhizosphaerae]|uniref:ABC transporter permease n=1 Tax=Chthonobacter rhizosphaerae TaxID=2735553 RepID=UPI0015EE60E6|nr:ABC transporter permease [Chthonobacter rhizosphaerae]
MRDRDDQRRIDRLGALLAGIGALAAVLLPFVIAKPNRIVAGEPLGLVAALPGAAGWPVAAVLLLAGVLTILDRRPGVRLAVAGAALAAVCLAVGVAADGLTPEGDRYGRVSPGGAFWLLAAVSLLAATDALARMSLRPAGRIGALVIAAGATAALLASGAWADLSFMREYAARADVFWREAARHGVLAVGSLAAAIAMGLPLGILCHRSARLRQALMPTLTLIQTIPSMALFGILMAPLGALAAALPLAHDLGIRGIGLAPALLALFLYALLPVVANTAVGLADVPAAVTDAGRGMGLTDRQLLTRVELPLAFPVILTGIRIVLVQNIGLATVAALIGGGGFGTFVFQGIGQTAMDLVLLGAVPTIALAFASAVILDAAAEAARRRPA